MSPRMAVAAFKGPKEILIQEIVQCIELTHGQQSGPAGDPGPSMWVDAGSEFDAEIVYDSPASAIAQQLPWGFLISQR